MRTLSALEAGLPSRRRIGENCRAVFLWPRVLERFEAGYYDVRKI